MNLALTVLNITAPVFLLASVGFFWVKTGHDYPMTFVTRIAMTVSVPCLVFVALIRTQIDPSALASLSAASFAAYGLAAMAFIGILRLFRLPLPVYLAPLVFGNTGNLGLPLALFAFGDAGLSYAVVVFAVMAILSFTIGVWVVAGGGSLTKVIREPVVAATFLGALFLWQGWQTPTFLTNALDLIGQMAIPLMLITLGVAIARLQAGALSVSLGLSVLKVAVCALAAWGTGVWFDLPPVALGVLIVQIATPVAVTSYLLASKYSDNAEPVAGLVVTSTLLSVVSLPLILAFVI